MKMQAFSERLAKSKKDLLNMYGAGISPEQKAHVQWASSKMPNENWSLWSTRAHKADPGQFTPEMKEKIEHFAGSQHIPEVSKVRFEKHHDLNAGVKMLENAEGEYNSRIASNINVVKPDSGTKKVLDVGNGMGWYSLGRGSCSAEGKAMGHCGNVPSKKEGDRILSLRTEHKDSKGNILHEPHATFISNGGYLGEMKGRGNTKPGKKYHKAIADLLLHPKIKGMVGGGYLHHQNFNINDLEPAERERVTREKPHISVYDNREVPSDLPEKFNDEVKPVMDFRNKLQAKHGMWRDAAVKEIAQGNGPKMALNALSNPTDDELHSIVSSPEANQESRVQAAMSGKDSGRLHAALATTSPRDISYLNNPNIDAILGTKNDQAISGLTENGSLSSKDVDRLVNHPDFKSWSEDSQENLLNHENLDPKHQEKFLDSPHEAVRQRLAGMDTLDPKFHDKLSKDPSESVRNYLAEKAKISPEIQQRLFDRGGHMGNLADNSNLDPKVGQQLADYAAANDPEKVDEVGGLRNSLVNNESTSPEALKTLAHGKNPEDSISDIYDHKNLPKDLFDELHDKHAVDPEAFEKHHSHILNNPHLSEDQFKGLKSKYGRNKSYSTKFQDHPFYQAKSDEINPMAREKVLVNHLSKLKEKSPEKYAKAQDKLIDQAAETGDLKGVKNLISSGALDDEHHAKLHDVLQEVEGGDHEHSHRQMWNEDKYNSMLHGHLDDSSLPTSYHDEMLKRLEHNGQDSEDIANKVFANNQDNYSQDASERADEISKENYPFSDYLDDTERGVKHPLDSHIDDASSSRYNKSNLSGLNDMAHERALESLRDSGKVDADGNYDDDDYDSAREEAKDSTHKDLRQYLENNQGQSKFEPNLHDAIDKHRDNLFERYDEAARDGDSYNSAYDEAMDEQKAALQNDPTAWPKHLQQTDWLKNNIHAQEEPTDLEEAPEGASDDGMDEFGVKKIEQNILDLKKRLSDISSSIRKGTV